ncbi:MAG TPA: hypothetical protein VIU11_05375 [Nakamurella sp.]
MAASISAGHASAATAAPVIIDTLTPPVAESDDGTRSIAVTLTNLDGNLLNLVVTGSDGQCTPSADLTTLPAQVSTKVTVALNGASCPPDGDASALTLTVSGTADASVPPSATVFALQIKSVDITSIDWVVLHAFWIAPILLLIVILLALMLGHIEGAPKECRKRWGLTLPYLGSTYSFKDSFVTNVTVLAGVVTSVVGSSTVIAQIDKDATQAVALAVVGAAISTGMAGAAPVLLELCSKAGDQSTSGKNTNTAMGLVVATAVTIGAAIGQLFVLQTVAEISGSSVSSSVLHRPSPSHLVFSVL